MTTKVLVLKFGEDTYEGETKHRIPNGVGTYKQNDKTYVGKFKNGKFHGNGKCTYKDGASYEG